MPAALYSVTATAMILLAAYGIHLVRDDGSSQLAITANDSTQNERRTGFVRVIDILGIKTQKFLRKLYGPAHLKSLDRRLKNAGNPEGLSLDLIHSKGSGIHFTKHTSSGSLHATRPVFLRINIWRNFFLLDVSLAISGSSKASNLDRP